MQIMGTKAMASSVLPKWLTTNGLFTQSVSVSIAANANTRMGAKPIEDAVVALLLTLALCVNRIIHNANVP